MKKNVDNAWYRLAKGAQVNFFDLRKIFDAGMQAQRTGKNLDVVMQEALKKYNKKK